MTAFHPASTASVAGPGPALSLRSFGMTEKGRVRPSNQDQFLVAELAKSLRVLQSSLPQAQTQLGAERGYLLVVADGMGGHLGGEHASALAVGTVEEFALNTLAWFLRHESGESQSVLVDLQNALRQADFRVFQEAASHPELRGMGTTVTLAYIVGATLFVIHVGASRCYLFRAGALTQLTHDHTVAQELVSQGAMTPVVAATHQYSRVITNSVGGQAQGLLAEVHRLTIGPGDVVLLCSDGLSTMLPDARIGEILGAQDDPAKACQRLVKEANAAGGRDNITGIVARIEAASGPPST